MKTHKLKIEMWSQNGICFTCKDQFTCPMFDLYPDEEIIELKKVHPIERNEKDVIIWCPMHYNK